MPLMPAPPTPMKWARRALSQAASCHFARRRGYRPTAHRQPSHAARPRRDVPTPRRPPPCVPRRGIAEQRRSTASPNAGAVEVARPRPRVAAPASTSASRVTGLVVVGRVRDTGRAPPARPERRQLGDRRGTRAAYDQVGRRERRRPCRRRSRGLVPARGLPAGLGDRRAHSAASRRARRRERPARFGSSISLGRASRIARFRWRRATAPAEDEQHVASVVDPERRAPGRPRRRPGQQRPHGIAGHDRALGSAQ